MNKKNVKAKTTLALSLVLASGITLSACTPQTVDNQETTSTSTIETTNTETIIKNQEEKQTAYKDGTYTAIGNYTSPAGKEKIAVKITLKDGIITESEVTAKAENDISIKMQSAFIAGYKSQVVGKNINEVKVDKVSGSSLTPKGFNAALEEIKKQAKS